MSTMSMRQAASTRSAVSGSRRTAVVVRASASPVDRRGLLAGFIAVGAAALAVPQAAQAMKIASQESTGGSLVGGGSMPKSSTAASAEGYTMEGFPGTKKPSYIAPGEKRELRSRARELAMKSSTSSEPKAIVAKK
ncbi:hypothetical protein FOA52_008653 [Chlamydomonas sp. UWO 241]|nr:hypothetical protein FOA52_008653 [Chlamydomonas sp. UWO 241]